MKYGTFKYGQSKYGAAVDAGKGTIKPIGLLNTLKLYLRHVGGGTANSIGGLTKKFFKSVAAVVSIFGNASRIFSVIAGSGIVSSLGNAAKTMFVYPTGVISNIKGNIAKQFNMVTGNGNVAIIGLLNNIKYYFLITIDQILKPLGVRVLGDSRYEFMPESEDISEEIPGRHGEISFGSKFKARPLELHVVTEEGLSPLEKKEKQRKISKYLNPLNGERDLVYEDDPTKAYKVKYVGKIDPENFPTAFGFTIPFKMNNPFVDELDEKILIGSGTITNCGTIEAPLTIEITGPVTNPSLTIGSDTLAYSGNLTTGQTLIIITEGDGGMTATINGTNAMKYYNGVFPVLPPETSLNVKAGSNVKIRWKDQWL